LYAKTPNDEFADLAPKLVNCEPDKSFGPSECSDGLYACDVDDSEEYA
jgi:hypothetical protein